MRPTTPGDRDARTGVKTWYNDIKSGHRSSALAGISGCAKELRTTYASEADALAAARRVDAHLA